MFIPMIYRLLIVFSFILSSHVMAQKSNVVLVEIASKFTQPTDIQFLPGDPSIMIILEKAGAMKWISLKDQTRGEFLKLNVLTSSEQGLLGLAFHPKFPQNRKFYLNYSIKSKGKKVTRISEWQMPKQKILKAMKAIKERVLLEVEQPYINHNAGQLAFGNDGKLYIGFGDGGKWGDPHGNGQNLKTMLGSMLRIDVDMKNKKHPYGIPKDNPFVGQKNALPEIWAYGLRNPWRYSFTPEGRLIVADVGQYKWEEISIVQKGKNMGWKIKEGNHCYSPKENCPTQNLVDPIYEYGRSFGGSITGGYVFLNKKNKKLYGRYIFGDFLSGRIWALILPKKGTQKVAQKDVLFLGKWEMQLSTFGQNASGDLFVAGYSSGKIFQIK